MADRVVRASAMPAAVVTQRLAASVPPRLRRTGFDRFTSGVDIADPFVAVEGGVYVTGHVQVCVRRGWGRQTSLRPMLTGRVVDRDGGSTFEGTLAPDGGLRAFAIAWVAIAIAILMGGLATEAHALVSGMSATEYLPIPIFGVVFVAFGTAFTVGSTRMSGRSDTPVLLAWLDAAMAPTESVNQ